MISLQDVQAAAARIAGAVVRTPCLRSETLSRIARADVWVKFENLQFTASFKERGALNTLLQLTPDERRRGVIAMSAGNHAQGVAYHAGRLGIPATIVMPSFTPNTKVAHTRGHGARVVLTGNTLAEAGVEAHRIADAEKLAFVHPYDDPRIIAGQGTMALEMLQDAPQIDTIVAPVGGGGMIAGCAVAARGLKPDLKVIGVESAGYSAMRQLLAGEPVTVGRRHDRRGHRRPRHRQAAARDRPRPARPGGERRRDRDRTRDCPVHRGREDGDRRSRRHRAGRAACLSRSCSPAARSGSC